MTSLRNTNYCHDQPAKEEQRMWRPGKAYREEWQSTLRTTDAVVVIIRAADGVEGLRIQQTVTGALQREGKIILDEHPTSDL